MTRGDIKIRTQIDPAFTQVWIVDSGTTSQAKAGEPCDGDDAAQASWTGEAGIMADGEGTTTQRFAGIAKSDSTETTSAAGEVVTWMPLPGIIYSGKAKTSTTADTAAEIKALHGKRVVFDLTSSAWTVDAAAADAVANCVVIVGGDHNTQELFFVYAFKGTYLGFCISG